MTDFEVKTTKKGAVHDTRWRASAHGEDSARPAQAIAGGFPVGLVKSGTPVSKSGTGYKKWATGETLDGFVNDDAGFTVASNTSTPTFAVLVHGLINPAYIDGGGDLAAAEKSALIVFVGA